MYLPYTEWPVGFTADNIDHKAVRAHEAEWEAFWRAVSHLQVYAMFVEIYDQGARVPEETLLKPLRQVRAGRFEVMLPWPTGLEYTGEFGDVDFLIRRPPVEMELMMEMNVAKYNPGPPTRRRNWGLFRR